MTSQAISAAFPFESKYVDVQGVYPGLDDFAETWALDRRFTPALDPAKRERRYLGWRDAVRRTLSG